MPLPANFNAFLGASLLGVVCAATLYVVEHLRQEKRRQGMAQDLARLDLEMSIIKRELDTLLAKQKEKTSKAAKRSRKGTRANSTIASSTATDDYRSAFDNDSSDLEFYDVSDEDTEPYPDLETSLKEIDAKLDRGDGEELTNCIQKLEDLCIEHRGNPEFLWRIGKARHRLCEKTDDPILIQDHIARGLEACQAALNLEPDLADVHKWFAILVGVRSDYLPMKDKIVNGHLFKKHVDAALALNPDDASLHHMLGRFDMEIASLKWYERKVATALFSEPPNATWEEALGHFLDAEKLIGHDWKENKLCIAKCKIQLGEIDEGVKLLLAAKDIESDNGADDKVDKEVKTLLEKYNSRA